MYNTPFPTPGEPGRPSLYTFLKGENEAGQASSTCSQLPDNAIVHGKQTMRWGAGVLDGIATHTIGSNPEIVDSVLLALKKTLDGSDHRATGRLYDLLCEDEVAVFIDPLLSIIAEDEDLDLAFHFELALWLAKEAPDRGPVKFGLAILGHKRDPELRELFVNFGLHEEFTLFAVVALQKSLADPTPEIWRIARRTRGWGRIQLSRAWRIRSIRA